MNHLPSAHCPLPTAHYSPISDSRSSISGIIGALAGLFACAALVFALRRLSGALVSPLSPALLLPSGLLAGMSVLSIRTLWRHSADRKASPRGGLFLDVLLAASLLLFAAALSLPGTKTLGLGFFWLLIIAGELWAWHPHLRQWLRRPSSKKTAIRPLRVDPAHSLPLHEESAETAPAAIADILIPPDWPAKDVTQQLTRSIAADGSDVLSGWLRMDFGAGQRQGSLHVAFCPPFAKTPELTIEQLDGPEARIKIAQLLPYGVRLDLKLVSFSEEPCCVLVQFCARSAETNHNS